VTEEDSALAYKRLLGELRGEKGLTEDVTNMTVEQILELYKKPEKPPAPLPVSLSDSYARWALCEDLLETLQWGPVTSLVETEVFVLFAWIEALIHCICPYAGREW
jgi:hypothetical protein